MKKHFFTAALLSSFFLASCEKEKAEPTPAVETITASTDASLYQTQSIPKTSPVPVGWVIIAQSATNYTIQYVAGAPFRHTVQVLDISPVGDGWVVVRKDPGTKRLFNCKGAPLNFTTEVVADSPIPPRYIISEYYRGFPNERFKIQNLNGARRGTQVRAWINSRVPTGWRLVSGFGEYKTLENTQDF